MRSRYSGRRLAVVFGIAIAGLVLAGSIAYVSIPGFERRTSRVLQRKRRERERSSQLNLVNSDQATCTNGQTAVTWSQPGRRGMGPTGPAGPSDIWDSNHYGQTHSLVTGSQNQMAFSTSCRQAVTSYKRTSSPPVLPHPRFFRATSTLPPPSRSRGRTQRQPPST